MKSTDNTERASADVARSGSNNFPTAPSPNGKTPAFLCHNATFCRPGGTVNVPVNEVHQHQTAYATTVDPQTINVLNYNMAIKSIPLRPRPMGPTNMNHQNFAMHQPWQAAQYGIANNNTQVSFNLQCKPVNGFISQNFFQKVNHDGMQVIPAMHPNTLQEQITMPPVVSQQLITAESVLPLELMQTPSKKEVLKRTLLEKSKENAKNASKSSCLSPISDCDVESSNGNADLVTSTSKKSIKGRKSSSTTSLLQHETQMSQSGIYDKLASLGTEPNRKYFLSQLFSFMNANNTPIKVMPVVCRQTVDLYKMYNIVKNLGGMEKVCKMKQWRDVSSALGFGGSTSAGFALKKNYCKYLFAYECKYDRDDVNPNLILVSLDLVSKLETKKKPQESAQSMDALIKEDSISQDSFSELSNGLEEYAAVWEKPNDLPVFLNFGDSSDSINLQSSITNVEYIRPTRFKRRKLTHHDCGNVNMHKVIQSLSSGLLCETTWALDCLSILTHDPSSPPLNLSKHPKLLSLLLELIISSVDKLLENTNDPQLRMKITLQDKIKLSFNNDESTVKEHLILFGYRHNSCGNANFYSTEHQDHKSKYLKKNSCSKFTQVLENERQSLYICRDFSSIPRRIIDHVVDNESRQEISEPSEDLFNVSCDILNDLVKKCICISNILRNFASMAWNEKEMASSSRLLMFLCFFLHFNHEHFIKEAENNGEEISDTMVNENELFANPASRVGDSFWWRNAITNIRSNCIVTLSYIASHVDLASLHGDICYKLCKGLLHWGVCQSSEAHDLHSGLNISIQRIALESLSKLCISRSNVDYVVATTPFYLVVNFAINSVGILQQNDSDIVRDIILGIISRLVESEDNLARALAIDGSAPFVLLGLIDEYIEPSILESEMSGEVFTYDNTSAKTSYYTACKAAEILCQLSRVPENVQYLVRFKKHLLEMVTSTVDDDVLTALISETLSTVG